MEKYNVDLIYNPFTQAAQLERGGANLCRPGSRLQMFVAGKPMQRWLRPVTESYQQWNGILPELAAELNEDTFTLSFFGTPEDYRTFSEAAREQGDDLRDIGFDPEEIKLSHTPKYTVKQLLDQMRELRQNWSVAVPSQKLVINRDRLDFRLQECDSMKEIGDLVDKYAQLISDMIFEIHDPGKRKLLQDMRAAWEDLLR